MKKSQTITTIPWNETHLNNLQSWIAPSLKAGGTQMGIGQPPINYLNELGRLAEKPKNCDNLPVSSISQTHSSAMDKCNRAQIRAICTDPRVDVIEAYASVMAWGGQHRRWFRESLKHDKQIRELLCHIRNSQNSRLDDFSYTQKACSKISTIGKFVRKLTIRCRSGASRCGSKKKLASARRPPQPSLQRKIRQRPCSG